jgi:prepilin-type N-terminal cleavage/methylation domain-containing protein
MKADGFSLIEVLVATAILIASMAGVARLFTISIDRRDAAAVATVASILAEQKLEELRDVAAIASPSPDNSLDVDIPPYGDLVDAQGVSATDAAARQPSRVFRRRWSITSLPGSDAVVLRVVVTPGDARLVTIRTRRAAP